MTDTATTGAAAAGTSEGATAASATTGSQAAAASDFLAGLQSAESRAWVESKGYKALDPLIESARHADKVQSELADLKAKALTPPAPDAKPEEWDAFYARMGRPEKAEGYEFALPKDLPPELPYDAEGAKAYKQWSHEAGLTPRQAQQLHDKFVQHTAGQWQGAIAATEKAATDAHGALVKEWGAPDSAPYKANVEHADRFIRNNGGDALMGELKAKGLLAPDGTVLSPMLAQAMAKAGKAYAEDGLATGKAAAGQRTAAETLFPTDPFKR